MPQISPCILLHEGLAPYASPLKREFLAETGLAGDAALGLPDEAPLWCGPTPGLVLQKGQGTPVFLCGDCTSTFDVAWELERRSCLPPWGAVLAVSQNQGRGQLRRHWHSPGGNLYLSFILPQDPLFAHDAASLVVGFLVQQALAALAVPTLLKWPNDILLQDAGFGAKVGGLLLEERDGRIIAGLGLNLKHSPPEGLLREAHAVPAASLEFWNLYPYPLWLKLSVRIREKYAELRQFTIAEALRRVETVLAWKNRPVQIEDGGEAMRGTIAALGQRGELLLRDHQGRLHAFHSGSIKPVALCQGTSV